VTERLARPGVAVVLLMAAAALAGQQTTPADPLWDRRATGAGSFQTVFEVSGRMELSIHRVSPNPQDLKSICNAQTETETAALDAARRDLQRLLATPIGSRQPEDLAWAYRTLGQIHAYQGEMAASGEAFDKAYEAIAPLEKANPAMREAMHSLELSIAVANLRRGELENCLTDHNAERCIFPISRRGVHQNQSGSARAVEYFTKALAKDPKNLETRWLLNVAYMTLGKYPDAVPSEHLIRVAGGEAGGAPHFNDIAHESGLPLRTRAGGAIIDDFDNDGRFDIVVSSLGPCDSLRIFHSAGGGRFEDVSERARVLDQTGGINISHTDYDNDGWLDIYVHRGGWEYPMRNSLLRNNRDGTFTDATGAAGLLDKRPHRTHTAAWADYDNDGWVDLFVGHEESPSALYHNERDGTFREVGAAAGVARTAFTKGATWGDYDNDGFADLYVSNYAARNFLFHNRKDGTFDEVAPSLGVDLPLMSFSTWFFDYDNDGWLDLFVTSFVPSVTEVVHGVMGLPPHAETMRLYRNNRQGGFQDVTAETGLARVVPAMGANFGDVDNDGFLDMYIGTGAPSYAALVPNVMLRNDGGRRFIDVTAASGTGHLQKGHGVAFGDVDGDGDDDLLANMGGFVPGDAYWKALFANPGNANRSLGVRLVGAKSNRAGIGARITAYVRQPDGTLAQRHRVVTSGGSFGASPYLQRIGLGTSAAVERLDVVWPASGARQSFSTIPAGQTIEIREDGSTYRRLDGSTPSGAIR
jgi:FG-GAP-like repeat/ASPIC and UnbV